MGDAAGQLANGLQFLSLSQLLLELALTGNLPVLPEVALEVGAGMHRRVIALIYAAVFEEQESAGDAIASGDGGNTWYDEKWWDPSLYMSVAATDDGTQPIPVKELVAQMVVSTLIARTDGLDLSNEVTLDGSATLEVKYL